MTVQEVLDQLRDLGNPDNRLGMAQFGINIDNAFGVRIPDIRSLAKTVGRDHRLALDLWQTGYHEARILACLIADPKQVTPELMDGWVVDFNSWDICDQACSNLFDKTPHSYQKAVVWSAREEEYVKRAGFVMMAALAVHDKEARDEAFHPYFKIILREANDERNFVKKAVNWALRQIGKRSMDLRKKALETCEQIKECDSSAARWIAADAQRELNSPETIARIARKK